MSGGVFIIGCPRSGTSVLSWALAQHADFWTSAESDFIQLLFGRGNLHRAYRQAYDRPDEGWLRKQEVGFREFARYMGLGVDELFYNRARGRRWIDSSPGYTLMAADLKVMFPQASFIHILRDGRAVVASMLKSGFEKAGFDMRWTTDFNEACKSWVHYASTGRRFVERHPWCATEIRHEDLTARPEEVFRELFDFLRAPAADGPAEFVRRKRINSSYDEGLKTTVEQEEAGAPRPWEQWDDKMRRNFVAIAGETMATLGYPVDF